MVGDSHALPHARFRQHFFILAAFSFNGFLENGYFIRQHHAVVAAASVWGTPS